MDYLCNFKDIILHIIGVIGTSGGNGHVIEFTGSAIASLSMEARMSLCNMAIEAGARAGLVKYSLNLDVWVLYLLVST